MVRPNHRNRRDYVYDRDGERCVYCGSAQRGPTWYDRQSRRLTLDHLVPTSQGGRRLRSNLVTCCDHCNNRSNMDIVAWLTLLEPETKEHGARAVRLVIQAMLSDVLDPSGEELLQRIQDTFSYVR